MCVCYFACTRVGSTRKSEELRAWMYVCLWMMCKIPPAAVVVIVIANVVTFDVGPCFGQGRVLVVVFADTFGRTDCVALQSKQHEHVTQPKHTERLLRRIRGRCLLRWASFVSHARFSSEKCFCRLCVAGVSAETISCVCLCKCVKQWILSNWVETMHAITKIENIRDNKRLTDWLRKVYKFGVWSLWLCTADEVGIDMLCDVCSLHGQLCSVRIRNYNHTLRHTVYVVFFVVVSTISHASHGHYSNKFSAHKQTHLHKQIRCCCRCRYTIWIRLFSVLVISSSGCACCLHKLHCIRANGDVSDNNEASRPEQQNTPRFRCRPATHKQPESDIKLADRTHAQHRGEEQQGSTFVRSFFRSWVRVCVIFYAHRITAVDIFRWAQIYVFWSVCLFGGLYALVISWVALSTDEHKNVVKNIHIVLVSWALWGDYVTSLVLGSTVISKNHPYFRQHSVNAFRDFHLIAS